MVKSIIIVFANVDGASAVIRPAKTDAATPATTRRRGRRNQSKKKTKPLSQGVNT